MLVSINRDIVSKRTEKWLNVNTLLELRQSEIPLQSLRNNFLGPEDCFAVSGCLTIKSLPTKEVFMRLIVVILLSVIFIFASGPGFAGPPNKADHLFFIERSINKNLVQYDVHLTGNSDLPDSSPVTVYWILENGIREQLTPFQRFAYGIASQVKLAKDKVKIILVALKGREIVVERIKGSFKAVLPIDGKQSILEKVYVKTDEKSTGIPKVLYIDLFAKAAQTNLPVKERIVPGHRQTQM